MIAVTLHSGLLIQRWSLIRFNDRKLAKRIHSDVVLPNPQYYQAVRAGRTGHGIERSINCYAYDEDSDVMTLPIGYLPQLIGYTGGQLHITDDRCLRLAYKPDSRIKLRDYQDPAVNAMQQALESTGLALLEAPPGSGKTEMALEIIGRLAQSTLWITHTKDLASQVRQRAIKRLGLDPGQIGMIGDGQEQAGSLLTIGLVQTLSRIDLAPWRNRFGCVVLDECHHSPASTWAQVVGSFAARYRFGVTGTLERNDGLERITHLHFGPTTYQINRSDAKGSAGVLTPRLRTMKTGALPETWQAYEKRSSRYKELLADYKQGKRGHQPRKPQMPYGKIINELLSDEERNKQIVGLLAREVPGSHSLILSARVEHCERLAASLRARGLDLTASVIHGGQSKKKRNEILAQAREGKIDALFSVNIAKEGLDVPILDQLFLVAGGKDPIFIKQAVGRIQRTHPGKTGCTVWDVCDEQVGVLKAQYWRRMQIYRELGMLSTNKQATA